MKKKIFSQVIVSKPHLLQLLLKVTYAQSGVLLPHYDHVLHTVVCLLLVELHAGIIGLVCLISVEGYGCGYYGGIPP